MNDLPSGQLWMPAATPPNQNGASASHGRRMLAWAIDFALTQVVAVLLAMWAFHQIRAMVTDIPGLVSEVGGLDVLRSGGGLDGVAADIGLALWHQAVRYIQMAFAALLLIVFCYHFATLAWKGRTIGKAILDLQVQPLSPSGAVGIRPGRGRLAIRAAVTTVTDIGVFALACMLLFNGKFGLSVLCWVVAVVVFCANVVPVAGRQRRTIGDVLAGTVVVRTGLHRAIVETAVHGGRLAADGIRQGGRIAFENARSVAASQSVQRAASSEPARQLQNAGRSAVDRARQLYPGPQKPSPTSFPNPPSVPYPPAYGPPPNWQPQQQYGFPPPPVPQPHTPPVAETPNS